MESCIPWAKNQLQNSGDAVVEQIADTEYSRVYKITDSGDIFYLKICPEKFYIEPQVINRLEGYGSRNSPKVIACCDENHCFLMQSSGDVTLKSICEAQLDGRLLLRGISCYTHLQRISENHLENWMSLRLEDWRLDKFSSLYQALINQREQLLGVGLTESEHSQLLELHAFVKKHCDALEKYAIPATISHCDFHPGNVIHDSNTDHLTVIDWGETVISHPFFSLCGYLWNVKYWFKLSDDDDVLTKCRLECIAAWLDCYDQEVLMTILDQVDQLVGLYAALGYYQLHKYADLKPKDNKRNYLVSVVQCLRSFIQKMQG